MLQIGDFFVCNKKGFYYKECETRRICNESDK